MSAERVKIYRPALQKHPTGKSGYVAFMTRHQSPRDSEWNGEESRQWVKLADYKRDITERDARISELTTAMQRQANAVKMIDMSHVARAETMMQHAQVLYDLSKPDELESLRQANAILTADVERAESELARLREQEPIGWRYESMLSGPRWALHFDLKKPPDLICYRNIQPLYAEPKPAKEAK